MNERSFKWKLYGHVIHFDKARFGELPSASSLRQAQGIAGHRRAPQGTAAQAYRRQLGEVRQAFYAMS